jgi:hypothetical protein
MPPVRYPNFRATRLASNASLKHSAGDFATARSALRVELLGARPTGSSRPTAVLRWRELTHPKRPFISEIANFNEYFA